jgi:hypothetical protein
MADRAITSCLAPLIELAKHDPVYVALNVSIVSAGVIVRPLAVT